MKPHHRRWATTAVIAVAVLALATGAAFGFIRAGVYDVGADVPHHPATHALLERLRDHSIRSRASKLTPPTDLMSEARVTQGAGNYDAMCTGCHLAPGMEPTEISKGLYPAPPNLSAATVSASEAFWTIKHGIKASGMPAWGASIGDDYIWNMAAFLQRLPKLNAAEYRALVASSGGHSHGGGETGEHPHHDEAGEIAGMPGMAGHDDHGEATPHAHSPDTPPHHDAPAAPATHTHAPGTPPHHDAPAHVDPPGTPPHSH